MEKSFLFLGLVQVVIECVTFSVKLKYSIEVYFLFVMASTGKLPPKRVPLSRFRCMKG